eukprot:gb/GEZN01001688.1/.p1 GENE.gb/GEZN01001688.1/~~gb/GEZN01001688.1/.p1  ORF type:complete len:735 (+),score=56.20 gb/GEZN01001688.1/:67-2271(+)
MDVLLYVASGLNILMSTVVIVDSAKGMSMEQKLARAHPEAKISSSKQYELSIRPRLVLCAVCLLGVSLLVILMEGTLRYCSASSSSWLSSRWEVRVLFALIELCWSVARYLICDLFTIMCLALVCVLNTPTELLYIGSYQSTSLIVLGTCLCVMWVQSAVLNEAWPSKVSFLLSVLYLLSTAVHFWCLSDRWALTLPTTAIAIQRHRYNRFRVRKYLSLWTCVIAALLAAWLSGIVQGWVWSSDLDMILILCSNLCLEGWVWMLRTNTDRRAEGYSREVSGLMKSPNRPLTVQVELSDNNQDRKEVKLLKSDSGKRLLTLETQGRGRGNMYAENSEENSKAHSYHRDEVSQEIAVEGKNLSYPVDSKYSPPNLQHSPVFGNLTLKESRKPNTTDYDRSGSPTPESMHSVAEEQVSNEQQAVTPKQNQLPVHDAESRRNKIARFFNPCQERLAQAAWAKAERAALSEEKTWSSASNAADGASVSRSSLRRQLEDEIYGKEPSYENGSSGSYEQSDTTPRSSDGSQSLQVQLAGSVNNRNDSPTVHQYVPHSSIRRDRGPIEGGQGLAKSSSVSKKSKSRSRQQEVPPIDTGPTSVPERPYAMGAASLEWSSSSVRRALEEEIYGPEPEVDNTSNVRLHGAESEDISSVRLYESSSNLLKFSEPSKDKQAQASPDEENKLFAKEAFRFQAFNVGHLRWRDGVGNAPQAEVPVPTFFTRSESAEYFRQQVEKAFRYI